MDNYQISYYFKIDTLERTCVYCHMFLQITEIFNVLSTQNDSKWHSDSFQLLRESFVQHWYLKLLLILKLLLGLPPVDSMFCLCFYVVFFFGVTNCKKCSIFPITLCETALWHVVCFFAQTLPFVLLDIPCDLLNTYTLYSNWSVMWLENVFIDTYTLRMLTTAHAKHGRPKLKYSPEEIQEVNATVHRRTYICQPSTGLLLSLKLDFH